MDNWEKNIFQTEGIAVPAFVGRLMPPCSKRAHRPVLSGWGRGRGGRLEQQMRPERSGLGQSREGVGASETNDVI